MAIKVHIPTGETSVTVKGLYQWDYGQVLEIECEEIGSEILEAHFACSNMPEAIVRICSFSAGVGTVLVPDECLEQTSPVSVWLCRSDSTQRHTIKTIVLPLTTRTRPSNTRDVPVDYTDTFGLLIEEVNEAIDALENGNVTAAKARTATTAGSAATAVSATNATYATSAGHANSAGTATTAGSADSVKGSLVAAITITNGEGVVSPLVYQGIYILAYDNGGGFIWSGVLYIGAGVSIAKVGNYSLQYYKTIDSENGTVRITSPDNDTLNGTLKFFKIGGVS